MTHIFSRSFELVPSSAITQTGEYRAITLNIISCTRGAAARSRHTSSRITSGLPVVTTAYTAITEKSAVFFSVLARSATAKIMVSLLNTIRDGPFGLVRT